MPRLPRRIASELNAKLRSPETAAVVAGIEGKLTRRRREQKIKSGAFRGINVVVFCGYVADDIAKVRVRVLEVPDLPGDSRIPYWDTAQANLRRHAALPMAGVQVELRIGSHSAREITDSHGFANFSVPVPKLTVGWHEAHAVTTPIEGGEFASGTGPVLKPSLRAPFLVISDIDDTILLTGLTEGVKMVARTVLRDAEERTPIAGMAALYEGLARGVTTKSGRRKPAPGFFYISTGSWAFYPLLRKFLDFNDFPQGPMFLTDWGPTERYLRRSGAEHKRTAIRRLLESYPTMPFVLIGDSGQRDALTYTEMALEFPGRVRLILIRRVGEADDERNVAVREHIESARADGVPIHLVADAAEAAVRAEDAGLCDSSTIDDVDAELE